MMTALIILMSFLQCADVGTTYYGMHLGAREGNRLTVSIVRYPVMAVAIKIPTTVLVSIGAPKVRPKWLGYACVSFVCLAVGLAVAKNMRVIRDLRN